MKGKRCFLWCFFTAPNVLSLYFCVYGCPPPSIVWLYFFLPPSNAVLFYICDTIYCYCRRFTSYTYQTRTVRNVSRITWAPCQWEGSLHASQPRYLHSPALCFIYSWLEGLSSLTVRRVTVYLLLYLPPPLTGCFILFFLIYFTKNFKKGTCVTNIDLASSPEISMDILDQFNLSQGILFVLH